MDEQESCQQPVCELIDEKYNENHFVLIVLFVN